MIYYFGYGINTNIDCMAQRVPQGRCLGAAYLDNYLFRFAYHADIVPRLGGRVDGVLWEIDQNGMDELDLFESYPTYYDRISVDVISRGQIVPAWIYVMQPGHDIAHPSSEYLAAVTEGYTENQVPLDQIQAALIVVEEQQ